MRLAVSNIAWKNTDSSKIYPILESHGVEGIVIAPTMIWPEAPYIDMGEAIEYKLEVEESGLVIASLQSLLYGTSGISLFGDKAERRKLVEHLKRQAELAGMLGAVSLIFGSPNIRKTNKTDCDFDMAEEVFSEIAVAAHDNNTVLSIEPLSGYGNTYITNTREGIELVERVNHPGFGLHLDSAAISDSGEDASLTVSNAMNRVMVTSFDISAPGLVAPSSDKTVPHSQYAIILRHLGYSDFTSVEMKGPNSIGEVISEIDWANGLYISH